MKTNPEQFTMVWVDVDNIAANPYNPEDRGSSREELSDILPSIEQHGILEPLIVVERSSLNEQSPDVPVKGREEYICGAGWRRSASARIAGQRWAPAIVRNEFANKRGLLQLVLIENNDRKGLHALDEAKLYEGLREEQTLEEIAQDLGRSPAHIHRRLKLLKLSPAAQDSLTAGNINLTEAAALVDKLSADQQDAALKTHAADSEERRLTAVIEQIRHAAEREQKEADLREDLAADSVEEIVPANRWGADAWKHQLDESEVRAAQERGTLAGAAVNGGRVTYYSSDIVPHAQVDEGAGKTAPDGADRTEIRPDEDVSGHITAVPDAVSATADTASGGPDNRPDGAVADHIEAAHAEAAKARHEACQRLINDFAKIKAERRNQYIAMCEDALTLGIPSLKSRRSKVRAWAGITSTKQRDERALPFASALKLLEDQASELRYARSPWPAEAVRHVHRLVELGYHTLSEHEQSKTTE